MIFKLINLIMACSPDNHLLPIICQRFFHLYLARVPMAQDESRFASAFGVADKLYEHNIGLMKRLKRFFAHVESELKNVSLTSSEDDEAVVAFNASASRLFGTFGLWLEETRLNQIGSNADAHQFAEFPQQYETGRLARIFAGDERYWTEFVYLPAIRQQQRNEADHWRTSCFRRVNQPKTRAAGSKSRDRQAPQEKIAKQLATYDAPLGPPDLVAEPPVIPIVTDTERLLGQLRADFAQLDKTARAFHTSVQELNFTDCNYKDLVRVLYSNRNQRCIRTLQCASLLSSNSCHGGRDVTITVSFHGSTHVRFDIIFTSIYVVYFIRIDYRADHRWPNPEQNRTESRETSAEH